MRVASLTPVAPQVLKNSPLPPNVPVPNVNTGTFNPEPPSCLNSMTSKFESRSPGVKRGCEERIFSDHLVTLLNDNHFADRPCGTHLPQLGGLPEISRVVD